MPLGSYYIRQDSKALLSYSHDGDVFSLDPIHAPTDQAAWDRFLKEFNEFATQAQRHPAAQSEPVRHPRAVREGVRPTLDRVQPVGAVGRSRQPDAQSVLQRTPVVNLGIGIEIWRFGEI